MYILKEENFMFEITHELIKRYASLRNKDAHVMPMYVSLYNERYGLNELNDITDYSPHSLKVGFVSVISPIEKRPCIYYLKLVSWMAPVISMSKSIIMSMLLITK